MDFVNETGQVSVDSTGAATVIETNNWCLLTLKLEGVAGGDNELLVGKGSTGMLVEAGDVVPGILLAPGMRVQVKTTSATAVKWGYVTSTFPGTSMISMLAYATAFLNSIACAINPAMTNKLSVELKKAGLDWKV